MAAEGEEKGRYDMGAVVQRVYTIEKALGDFRDAISALSTKLDERSRTPWATLIAFLALVLTFFSTVGFLAYSPIQAELTRHEMLLTKMQDRTVEGLLKQIDRLEDRLNARPKPSL